MISNRLLKIYLSLSILLTGNACEKNDSINAMEVPSDECPVQPTVVLDSSNVKRIFLTNEAIATSGVVSQTEHIGYIFNATSGQKLKFETKEDLCIWLYTPENQLLKTNELPITGNYIIQIASPKDSKTFGLEISFQTEPISQLKKASSVSSPQTFRFNPVDFPQYACGDSKPTNPDDYPVNYYPVYVPYSRSNLSKTRLLFCRDAYQKIIQDTGEKVVQIASFLSKDKAQNFAVFVSTEILEPTVGDPTVIYE